MEGISYLSLLPSLSPNGPSVASVNVANFVPTKLQWLSGVSSDTNYVVWRKQMLCLIKSQGLIQYVDGSLFHPLLPGQDYDVWERYDALVMGWIMGSLSDQIASTFVECHTANQLWIRLEDRFGRDARLITISAPQDEPKKCVNDSTPLHKAVLEGDWEAAERIFTNDPKTKSNWIDGNEKWRALHIAVSTGLGQEKAVNFLRNLVQMYSGDDLESLRDAGSSTALHIAASVGNKDAAVILVKKKQDLCYTQNRQGNFPIHVAAQFAQRDVLEYLIGCTKDNHKTKPYAGWKGQLLVVYLIQAEFFDIALRLVVGCPRLLKIDSREIDSPLTVLTRKMHALNLSTRNYYNFWDCLFSSLPQLCDKIVECQQARRLLGCMCKEIRSQHFTAAAEIFHEAVCTAAELGVKEVIVVIMETFPGAIHYPFAKTSVQHILFKAIQSRSEDVFNLIYEMSGAGSFFAPYSEDNNGNNPLHLAGKWPPPHKLDETPSGAAAAVQMQREIRWFKEVEKVVHPYSRKQMNNDGKTPRMVFTEEHNGLKKAGEKWMKETATSFSLVAMLIAIVMFAGSITVPTGDFTKELVFMAFAISDIVSLLSATASLLLFLGIFSSRYAEEDFLYKLPTKFISGVIALSLAFVSMMVSFTATLYIVFGQQKDWVLFPLLIFACLPVAMFELCRGLHLVICFTV